MALKQQQLEADAPRVYFYQCDEINKRSMGVVQLKYCGNEGTIDDTSTDILRKTFQAVISHIPNEPQEVWRNAEIKIFDYNFDKYIIRSGDGRNRFEAMDNGMDDFKIVKLRIHCTSKDAHAQACYSYFNQLVLVLREDLRLQLLYPAFIKLLTCKSKIYTCDVVSDENVRKAVRLFCSVLSSSESDEATKHSLLLLQDHLIKSLPDAGSGVCTSAKVYFLEDNRFILQSGSGSHILRVHFNGKGEESIENMIPEIPPRPTESKNETQAHAPISSQQSKSAWVVRPAAQSANDDKQKHFEFPCEEINQRNVGKAILKFCGNEGTVDNNNKATLRRLLQALISFIPLEQQWVWKNAEVKIYDDECDVYIIHSGNGQHHFVGTFDGMDNARIVRATYDKSECCVM